MIGHIPLISIRKAGKRPEAVWIWVGKGREEWAVLWANFSDLLAHPEIVVQAQDDLKCLDLRCLKNLQVHVDGNDSTDRIFGVHLACLKAGAKDVFTYHNGELIWDRGEDYGISKAR